MTISGEWHRHGSGLTNRLGFRLRWVLGAKTLALLFVSALSSQATQLDVRVQAADGIKLAARYYTPEKPGPAILFFHQCSRDLSVWDPLASKLADQGFRVLVVSPRGIGPSEGEAWDYDGNLDHALQYWRDRWRADAESSYRWLLSQRGVNQQRVGIAGAGCGAFLALLIAQTHYPTAKTLVLLSGFEDRATSAFVAQADRLSILGVASSQDAMSIAAVEKLKQLSKNPMSRLIPYPEPAHGIGLLEKHPELEPNLVRWFQTELR